MPDEARLREAERQFREDAAMSGLRVLLGDVALCVYRERWWLEAGAVPAEVADFRPWRGEAVLPWAGGMLDFRRRVRARAGG